MDKRLKQIESQIKAIRTNQPEAGTDAKQGEQGKLAKAPELIEELYLRTLTRLPSDNEQQRSLDYLASYDNPVDGLKGLLWALVNTKEFIVNH